MKLSILICSIVSRKDQLKSLLTSLEKQKTKEVEILVEVDNREISVGRKRQVLLEKATGDYVVFIDDDDEVAVDYVQTILKAIEDDPDCIGMFIKCNLDGKIRLAKTSYRYKEWKNNVHGYDYVRGILHLNPVRRWIALKIGYKDVRFKEDHDYSTRLAKSGLLQKEVFLEKEMYLYKYKYQPYHIKYGI